MSTGSGFSLSELLLVLLLISILTASAIPSLRLFSQHLHAQAMQDTLNQTLESTRLLASLRHQTIILCGSENGRLCSKQWDNGWLIKTQNGRILDTWHFHHTGDRLYYRLFPAGRSSLVFTPSGRPEIENGTFWYCPAHWPSPAWALVLDRFGKRRAVQPNRAGLIYDSHGKVLPCLDS